MDDNQDVCNFCLAVFACDDENPHTCEDMPDDFVRLLYKERSRKRTERFMRTYGCPAIQLDVGMEISEDEGKTWVLVSSLPFYRCLHSVDDSVSFSVLSFDALTSRKIVAEADQLFLAR